MSVKNRNPSKKTFPQGKLNQSKEKSSLGKSTTDNKEDSSNARDSKKGIYSCEYERCGYVTKNKYNLQRHINRVHLKLRPFICEKDGKAFASKSELVDHSWTHKDEKRYSCPDCEYKNNSRTLIRDHIKYKHKNQFDYICPYEKNYFYSSNGLKRHINSVHLHIKPYSCEHCKKPFPTKVELRRHYRTHTGEKPFHCNICNVGLTSSNVLKEHLFHHNGKKPYKCDFKKCGFSTSYYGNFVVHVNGQHLDKKPYSCNIDKYATASPSNFAKHMRIHTGEKPYVCENDGTAFIDSSHLKRHVKSDENIKEFQCIECSQFFGEHSHLKDHLLRHKGIRSYICDKCKYGFVTRGELHKHLIREACWYSELTWRKWEKLCVNEIASILLEKESWVSFPKIDTPDFPDKNWIQPEIFYENSEIEVIIDAKRTTLAVDTKDMIIYPNYADQVIFWCLYGKSKVLENDDAEIIFKSSQDLIEELKSKITTENKFKVNMVIQKILDLKSNKQKL